MMVYATLGDYRRRRQRSVVLRLGQFMLFLALVIGASAYAYEVGVSATEVRLGKLEVELDRFQDDNLRLREQLALAAHQNRVADETLDELRERYRRDIPVGPEADLLDDVRRQLERGVTSARLAFLIRAAGRGQACEEAATTKRFVVRTPLVQGPISAVRFDDRIVVTGSGEAVVREDGLPEAWFDAARPVALQFSLLNGDVEKIEGTLPIRHSVAAAGREYRFVAIAGDRSFIEISAQICDLPETLEDEAEPQPVKSDSLPTRPTVPFGL